MNRLRPVLPLLFAGLAAGTLAYCRAGSPGDASNQCKPLDLAPWTGSGMGAHAKVATESDLIGGEAATGRAGDFLLDNGVVRVLIEQPGRAIGPQPYGGNIIDADVVRSGPGHDRFGEVGSFINFGRTIDADKVEVIRDGSGGGAAIIAASGKDTQLDFVNLPGIIASYIALVKLPDVERDMHLRSTTYYVLQPGANSVQIVQQLCNEGTEKEFFPVGDLVDSGGQVDLFGGREGRFGAGGGISGSITDALDGADEPFVAWVGEDVAYGYIPPTDINQAVTVSGVTVSMLNSKGLIDWLSDTVLTEPPEGAITLSPKESVTVTRDFVVGHDLAAVFDHWYRARGTSTGTVQGLVQNSGGQSVAGVRVAALRDGQTLTVFTTDAAGQFSGQVPAGSFTLQADDNTVRSSVESLSVDANGSVSKTLTLAPAGTIAVHVRDDSGAAIPAKITIQCPGACAWSRNGGDSTHFRDTVSDGLPSPEGKSVFDMIYLGPDGELVRRVPAGTYKVWASRGPEWSLASSDVTVVADATSTVSPVLAHVVDTTGWMSGDFHVHAVNSPDSPVPNRERLRDFMAEGIDVIVSTDHDYITDFRPWLAQIPDGDKFLAAITGVELTTFDYGHYNAFPLTSDTAQRNGGAVDWAGGHGLSFSPGQIFEALDAFPGEQVVQVNHARSGYFSMLGLDTRTLWTNGDRALHRIGGEGPDPVTGDTRLFDTRFTAMELMNGSSLSRFSVLANDWFALLSRGVRKTGTAVSDTHMRHGEIGPRTYVRVASDDPKLLDQPAFAHAVNAGQAFGTNGPFVKLVAKAGANSAALGETLTMDAGTVTVEIDVLTPPWMEANKVQFFVNAGEGTEAGKSPSSSLPTPVAELALTGTPVDGDGSALLAHATAQLTIPADSWIVAVVTGDKEMFPVVGNGSTKPLAFTNPIYVDVQGNGWTPSVDLAAERARVGRLGAATPAMLTKKPTEAQFRHLLSADTCSGEDLRQVLITPAAAH